MSATLIIARLALTRMFRGRSLWLTLFLALAPVTFCGLSMLADVDEPWRVAGATGLRLFVLLSAAIHLAGAVSEEVDNSTYTFLWSRPLARVSMLLGKIIAVVPVLIVIALLAFGAAYVVAFHDDLAGHLPEFARLTLALCAGIVTAGCFSAGLGTIVPRYAFIIVLGYMMILENLLTLIPNLGHISILHHMSVIADLPNGSKDPSVSYSLGALGIMTALWLIVGAWRVTVSEYGKADR